MLRLASIFVLVTAGACFYTDPINDRPVARITKQNDAPHHKGQIVRFDAAKSEDDSGNLTAHWSAFACSTATPPICESLVDQVTKESLTDAFELAIPMTLSIDESPQINIELEVEDRSGAIGRDILPIVVQNRDPTVRVQVQGFEDPRPGGGFVLGLPLDIVAEVTDEDFDAENQDQVTLGWEYRSPTGSNPNNVTFEEAGKDIYRLTADVFGLWTVVITADDGEGGVTTHEEQILVSDDRAPCITATDPVAVAGESYIVERSQGLRRFAVLQVVDELDVFPLSDGLPPQMDETAFSWKIATPDTNDLLVPLTGHVVADYVLDPSAFSPGDLVELQVAVDDRVARQPCDSAEPTCSTDANCFQRLTWGVEIR